MVAVRDAVKHYQSDLEVRWYYRKPEIASVEKPTGVGEAEKTSPGWFHQEAHNYRLSILSWIPKKKHPPVRQSPCLIARTVQISMKGQK